MFPLSCACVRVLKSREMDAQKNWSAHQFSIKNTFCTCMFHTCRSKYKCVLVNVAHRKLCAHTDFKKLEGTLMRTNVAYVFHKLCQMI